MAKIRQGSILQTASGPGVRLRVVRAAPIARPSTTRRIQLIIISDGLRNRRGSRDLPTHQLGPDPRCVPECKPTRCAGAPNGRCRQFLHCTNGVSRHRIHSRKSARLSPRSRPRSRPTVTITVTTPITHDKVSAATTIYPDAAPVIAPWFALGCKTHRCADAPTARRRAYQYCNNDAARHLRRSRALEKDRHWRK